MTKKEQWKKDRAKGIGGSDISAILGLNPYKTAYDVWLDKTGQADDEDFENDNTVAGHILEDAVAKMAEHKYNIKVLESTSGDEIYVHPQHEIVRGTPDRFYLDLSIDKPGSIPERIMEIKTTQIKIQSKEDIPKMWILQPVWYMGINDAIKDLNSRDDLTFCVAYIHSGRFLNFGMETYDYNQQMRDLFQYMVEEAEKFWEKYVLTNTPPPAQTSEDVIKMFGEPEKKLKEATDELLNDYNELKTLKAQQKAIEEKIGEYEEAIKMFVGGEHEGVSYNGENIVKWSFTKPREGFDKKALKDDHPDIYEKYRKEGKASRRFTIR